jgi:hypothetical protein
MLQLPNVYLLSSTNIICAACPDDRVIYCELENVIRIAEQINLDETRTQTMQLHLRHCKF